MTRPSRGLARRRNPGAHPSEMPSARLDRILHVYSPPPPLSVLYHPPTTTVIANDVAITDGDYGNDCEYNDACHRPATDDNLPTCPPGPTDLTYLLHVNTEHTQVELQRQLRRLDERRMPPRKTTTKTEGRCR
eukprot:1775318-Pyramimonas_sp.AAC.1